MSEKIISNNGELIFEFGNGLSFDALFVHALKAKFEGKLSADILLPHPRAKSFLESLLKHLKKTNPRAYDINGIWDRTLDEKLNEKVTDFLVSYADVINWKLKTKVEKSDYLNEVFFPWVQPKTVLQKIVEEIDRQIENI